MPVVWLPFLVSWISNEFENFGKRGSALGKQNIRVTCPTGKVEFESFLSPLMLLTFHHWLHLWCLDFLFPHYFSASCNVSICLCFFLNFKKLFLTFHFIFFETLKYCSHPYKFLFLEVWRRMWNTYFNCGKNSKKINVKSLHLHVFGSATLWCYLKTSSSRSSTVYLFFSC